MGNFHLTFDRTVECNDRCHEFHTIRNARCMRMVGNVAVNMKTKQLKKMCGTLVFCGGRAQNYLKQSETVQ